MHLWLPPLPKYKATTGNDSSTFTSHRGIPLSDDASLPGGKGDRARSGVPRRNLPRGLLYCSWPTGPLHSHHMVLKTCPIGLKRLHCPRGDAFCKASGAPGGSKKVPSLLAAPRWCSRLAHYSEPKQAPTSTNLGSLAPNTQRRRAGRTVSRYQSSPPSCLVWSIWIRRRLRDSCMAWRLWDANGPRRGNGRVGRKPVCGYVALAGNTQKEQEREKPPSSEAFWGCTYACWPLKLFCIIQSPDPASV